MVVIYLSKQQALDAHPRAIQQITFTANSDRAGTQESISFSRKERNCFELFTRNYKIFVNAIPLRDLIFVSIK